MKMMLLTFMIAALLFWNVHSTQTEFPDLINEYLALVVVVQNNTEHHLSKWIQHHKALGVDKVIVIDNTNSTYFVLDDILPFVQSGFVLNYHVVPALSVPSSSPSSSSSQPLLLSSNWIYEYIFTNFQLNFHFIGFVYENEYIVLPKFKASSRSPEQPDLKTLSKEEYRMFGQLSLMMKESAPNDNKNLKKLQETRPIINTRHLEQDKEGLFRFTGHAYAVDSTKSVMKGADRATDSAEEAGFGPQLLSEVPSDDLFKVVYVHRYLQ